MSSTDLHAPAALVSYAHDDGLDNALVLAQELRLRGLRVIRDIDEFRAGRSLDGEMEEATDAALVVGHLGPAALDSDAVITKELRPALRAYSRDGSPVVVLVPHGIGATRADVDSTIAGRLPYSAAATWAIAPSPTRDPLTTGFAARVAQSALHSIYAQGRGPDDGHWDIVLSTRGSTRHGKGLTIDATELVGGDQRRPGGTDNWHRIKDGINDLARVLGAHGARRALRVTCGAHGTAGILFGLAFSRAALWDLTVAGPGGDCRPSGRRILDGIREARIDGPPDDCRLFVGIDLVPRGVAADIDRLCEQQGRLPGHQLVFDRINTNSDMTTEEICDASSAIAARIKAAIDQWRPTRLDLFVAGPAPLSILLGAELATLGLPIGLWEHDDLGYVSTLDVRNGTAPAPVLKETS